MRKGLTGILALLLLAGCDRIDEWLHPYDDTAPLQAIPAAPGRAAIEAYGGMQGALRLEVRPGDCARLACLQFIKGRWEPLAAADTKDLPLLGIDSATGSGYSADLWHAAGHGSKVLVNAGAGEQNIAAGRFDGLRIGISVPGRQGYVTAFALSGGETVAIDARVVATEGRAWLVQTRPDHGVNIVELFAIPATPAIHCLPGLAIDTTPWAGPLDVALSPDLFVSRAVDPDRAETERQAVLAACTPKPEASKGTP